MVTVVSDDAQLHRLTAEILSELHRGHLLTPPGAQLPAARNDDICIVDWSPEQHIPEPFRSTPNGWRLYLVDQCQVERICSSLPSSMVGVLLKPVNRTALKLSLEQALRADGTPSGSPATSADRDDILQCLLLAYLRLQEHDSERMNFLARAVHDFRAPLTAINGYCGLLLEDLLGPLSSQQKEVLQRMQQSARRLARMAISMFELTTRGKAGSMPEMQPHSIEESVAQAVHEIRPACEERDVSITVQLAEPPDPLYFDAGQLEQVLVNLIENAARFAAKHGFIDLNGYPYFSDRLETSGAPRNGRQPNSYRIDIKDNGPAISPEFLPFVFEESVPAPHMEDRSAGGLSLAICKSIIDVHHGEIWAESGPDGTVFSFVLPVRRSVRAVPVPLCQ